MFHLLKIIIWLTGFAVVAIFVLGFFGYELNTSYFTESKEDCQERLKSCQEELIRQGVNNAECSFNCVNPKLILKEKQ